MLSLEGTLPCWQLLSLASVFDLCLPFVVRCAGVQEAQDAVRTAEASVKEREAQVAAQEQQLAQERARIAQLQVQHCTVGRTVKVLYGNRRGA